MVDNFKWYHANSSDGSIALSNPIEVSKENIFSNVTDEMRIAGSTQYQKVYVRNESGTTIPKVVAWIEHNTPAPGDQISIRAGGTKSLFSYMGYLTGTIAFANGSDIVAGYNTLFSSELAPGEIIRYRYEAPNYQPIIDYIESNTRLVLRDPWPFDSAHGPEPGVVMSVSLCEFYQPSNIGHASALELGDMPALSSKAIWIRRNVYPGADGFLNNYFTLEVGKT